MALPKKKEQEYIEKVKQDGLYLKRIKKNQTEAICLEAVKQNGLALEYVNKQTPEICLAAVRQNGKALEFVNTYGVTYPVYQADRSLLSYFAINPIPTSFVFDKDGNLLDSMVGYMSKDIVERIAQFGGE